jgi:hypothetical protein
VEQVGAVLEPSQEAFGFLVKMTCELSDLLRSNESWRFPVCNSRSCDGSCTALKKIGFFPFSSFRFLPGFERRSLLEKTSRVVSQLCAAVERRIGRKVAPGGHVEKIPD